MVPLFARIGYKRGRKQGLEKIISLYNVSLVNEKKYKKK